MSLSCVAIVPYLELDENGHEILNCNMPSCKTKGGKAYHSRESRCLHARCKNTFRSGCASVLFCSEECFLESGTKELWNQAVRLVVNEEKAHKVVSELKRKKIRRRYEESEKGRLARIAQNRRYYAKRKLMKKTEARQESPVEGASIAAPGEGDLISMREDSFLCRFICSAHSLTAGSDNDREAGGIYCTIGLERSA